MIPRKLNNSLVFFRSICLFSSFVSVVGKEAGRQWEIVWEDVGCIGATANFIAPRYNN
jgi:hypothetical protein